MLENAWALDTVTRQHIEALRDEAVAEKRRRALARAAAAAGTVDWREAFQGVALRTLVTGPDLMMTLLRFRRGAVAEFHHHGAAQAGYVLDGRLRVTLPGRQLSVEAGECYVLPPNVPHQIRALDDAVVLDAFTPSDRPVQPGAVALEPRPVEPAVLPVPRRRPSRGLRTLRRCLPLAERSESA